MVSGCLIVQLDAYPDWTIPGAVNAIVRATGSPDISPTEKHGFRLVQNTPLSVFQSQIFAYRGVPHTELLGGNIASPVLENDGPRAAECINDFWGCAGFKHRFEKKPLHSSLG